MCTNHQPETSIQLYLPVNSKENFHNQTHYHRNYMKSYLNSQHKQTQQLSTLLEKLQTHSTQSQNFHKDKLNRMEQQLTNNDLVNTSILEKLTTLHEQCLSLNAQLTEMEKESLSQKELFYQESLKNTALFDTIMNQDQNLSRLTEKNDEFNLLANEMNKKFHHNEEMHAKLEEKLSLQEVFHTTILENIEETNAKVSKVSRQLDHIKEVIFERIHYLTSKVEESLKIVALPVQKFFLKLDEQEKAKDHK